MAKLREVQAPKATVIREEQQLDIDSQMVIIVGE
jgi:predicted esterase